jgi:magnesium transporter
VISIYQHTDEGVRKLTIQDLNVCLANREGVFWVDLEDPDEAEEETVLVSLFDFHPLSIEDAMRGKGEEGHLPKVEDFADYLFVIVNPVDAEISSGSGKLSEALEIRTTQLTAYLTPTALVTHHYKPLRSLSNAVQFLRKNPDVLGRGPDYVFHLIIDDIVDDYTPILDRLDETLDSLEEEVFKSANQGTMSRLLRLKRTIMTVRRVAFYQREMLNRLSRGEFSLISRDEMAYYRNVYDHLVRVTDLTDSYRDLVTGLLDAYLSVTSNRLNQVMKVLTIISTIFLPLSFITGFFGMNFRDLPGADSENGVLGASLFMIFVGLGMLWIFRRNKWL